MLKVFIQSNGTKHPQSPMFTTIFNDNTNYEKI